MEEQNKQKPDQIVEFSLQPEDIAKLMAAQGARTSIKGFIREGKLTITGIQHEFKSAFMHNWPPSDDD